MVEQRRDVATVVLAALAAVMGLALGVGLAAIIVWLEQHALATCADRARN